jgi:fatty-acyl-CoA synthase
VLPAHKLDGKSLHELVVAESVTQMLGVPTVWLGLLDYLDSVGAKLTGIERIVVGGAALSEALLRRFEEDHDTRVIHAWGMTEMSPLGVAGMLKPKHEALAPPERRAVQLKQGRVVFGVDMRIVDDEDRELPRDGATPGHLQVRGPWIASQYFRKDEDPAFTADGWFRTGDVATLDSDGYMRITDRAKDVIKSGGEWISSLDIENAAMTHAAVAEAAVIGLAHPKWQERPLLIVKRRPGAAVEAEAILAHLEGRIARWWLPDRIEFVDEIPHGATGKVAKIKLREMFAHITLE